MNKPTPGPWHIDPMGAYHCNGNIRILAEQCTPVAVVPEHLKADARLIAAAPQLYDAVEAADTLCAVLNISDLTPQARGCVREAWPLIQIARAAARPNSAYAEAVKEGQQHEIKRLDSLIAALTKALGYAIERADAWHDDSRGGDCPELEDERATLTEIQRRTQ